MHAGSLGNCFAKLGKVLGAVRPGIVGVLLQWKKDGHDILRLIAEGSVEHVDESLNGGAGGCHEEKREGNLSGNKGGMQMPAAHAAGEAPHAALHDLADVGTR